MLSARFHADSPLENAVQLPIKIVADAFERNPFFDLQMERLYWEFPRFRVPPGTSISLSHTPSSPATGVEKREVRMSKAFYFDWVVTLEPVTATPGLPAGVELLGEGQPVPHVVFTKVTVTSTFDRFTAGNHYTRGYMEWTAWLTQQLKARLSAGT